MISPPAVDGRRVESFFQELQRFAPHYTPDLNLSDQQGAGVALMRIFAQLAEIVAVRLDQAPQKNFVAFLDKLGITLLPARPARAAVTFRLASGLEEAVKVPSGTRVTAPGEEDEIPFETTGELVAIPGVLIAAYGVDPLKDLIFSPPPGFLKQEPRTPTELSYEIQSFVPAGSNRLQLNHATELEPGSFLRIGCKEKKVVQKVDEGNFVTLYEPVRETFAEGTIVVPIRNFEVFNGIDRQEHILYIGHNTLFTVKEEVEITLEIELKDAQTTLQPLDLVWQFWTKDETKTPEDEEHWELLDVKSDGTAGLSSSGRVVLVKKKDLEIKPRKVGGRESRWIRTELKEKLPVGPKELPEIETISVGVGTPVVAATVPPQPIGILADQGFYNATPLDVQVKPDVGFLPFGTEPRQFDQFYVASKEAFSKREANVTLNFDLDLQTLAGPSVVSSTITGVDQLHAYSIGLRRALYHLNTGSGDWENLGNPADEPILERLQGSGFLPVEDSVPSAIAQGPNIFVFVNTEDSLTRDGPPNRIWVHRPPGSDPLWKDLGAPGPTPHRVLFSPAGVILPGSFVQFARVFAVAGDGKLYSRAITNAGEPDGSWVGHGAPPGVTLNSPAFVIRANNDVLVFINGNGGVHRFTLRSSSPPEWLSLKSRDVHFSAISRPFAQPFGPSTDAKVFVFGLEEGTEKWKLLECDTTSRLNNEFSWEDLGRPTEDPRINSNPEAHSPTGYIEQPGQPIEQEGKHIFLRDADNQLYERLDGDTPDGKPRWELRSRPDDPSLRDSPTVNVTPGTPVTTVHVISASAENSLITWDFELTSDTVAADARRRAVLLDEEVASDADGHYVGADLEIVSGPGSGSPADQVISYDGALKLARLTNPLTAFPTAMSQCEIGGEPVGNARSGNQKLFALHSHNDPATDPRPGKLLQVRVDGDVVNFDFYSRMTGIVSLNPADVTGGDPFVLYAEIVQDRTEHLPLEDRSTIPELSWEYWNGSGWLSLRGLTDGTQSLLKNDIVIFKVPKEIESTEVAGQENFWIRARLIGGDYGRETFRIDGNPPNQTIVSVKSSLRPPKVRELRISYDASLASPEACLTFNNLEYLDQTAACEAPDSHFPPFETLEDKSFTLFFGFDKTFKTGPVRLLLDATERNYDETKPPEFAWSFRKDRKWKNLDAEDGTVALTRQGILTVSASEELTRESRFGEALYWIKGSLRLDRALAEIETEGSETVGPCGEKETVKDPCAGLIDETEPPRSDSKDESKCTCADCNCGTRSSCAHSTNQAEDPCAVSKDATQASKAVAAASADYPLPLLRGVFLNTVWAIHGETITEEIVGSGDGEPGQTHALQQDDVLEDEDIRIQEALSVEERERIERELGKDSVVDRDDLGGTWVSWKEVKALFDCGPQDRCYEIDRAAGVLRFGDGLHGRIPTAGVDNIRAFRYRTGGGVVGNVATNKIEALATAVAGIESVFNPTPAGGGSDKADTNAMLTIGPRRISHRDRAVSVEDFEELAHEASRQVAKVRCLGTTNLIRTDTGLPDPCDPRQLHQALEERGRVSLIIVPDSPDPRPCPSLELRRAVKEYLRDRAPSVVAAGERIVVRPPDYVTVGIQANIFVTTLEKAATAETQARKRLEEFLHPVRGGPEGNGWEFGRPISKSDVFAELERIADIDRVEDLVFQFRGRTDSDRVVIGPNELLASGEHKLAIKKA
ncbi:MAG: putative baseplate assembly protein [Pyrinomonadaceae bacterium]